MSQAIGQILSLRVAVSLSPVPIIGIVLMLATPRARSNGLVLAHIDSLLCELRMLFVLTDFDGLELAAWPEDVKTGLRSWVRDHGAWKRFALITDAEWVRKAMHMFTWLTPGEVMVGQPGEEEEAKRWIAA